MQVTGKAKVHGIEGVELTAQEASYSDKNDVVNRTFVAQLTDTHCRYLATLRNDGDIRNYITFLDGDEFCPTGDLVRITAETKLIWFLKVIFSVSAQRLQVLTRTSCWILSGDTLLRLVERAMTLFVLWILKPITAV